MSDEDLKALLDILPDCLERGQDGMDLSRLDPGVGLVYTGLGGVGQRLRYIVIVGVAHPPLAQILHATLQAHWRSAAEAQRSSVESIHFTMRYIQIQLLIPMDVAPADVVEDGLARCNRDVAWLHPDYFITNVEEPDEETIEDFLRKIGM